MYILCLWTFFYSSFLSIFGVGLPAYFSNHSPFSRQHILVRFDKFPSLARVLVHCHIHHHWGQPFLIFKEWDWIVCVCSVMCTDPGPISLTPIWKDWVQLSVNPLPKGKCNNQLYTFVIVYIFVNTICNLWIRVRYVKLGHFGIFRHNRISRTRCTRSSFS